jgi:hypothetical protein
VDVVLGIVDDLRSICPGDLLRRKGGILAAPLDVHEGVPLVCEHFEGCGTSRAWTAEHQQHFTREDYPGHITNDFFFLGPPGGGKKLYGT